MSVNFKDLAEWLAKVGPIEDHVRFWNLCGEVNGDSVPSIVKVWGLPEPMPPIRTRVADSVDFRAMSRWLAKQSSIESKFWRLCAEVESVSAVVKVWGFDPLPTIGSRKRPRGKLESLVDSSDESADESSDESSAAKKQRDDGQELVGHYFLVDVEGESTSVLRLQSFDPWGEHTIEWLYTIEQLRELDIDIEALRVPIERVEQIEAVALVRTNHTQTLVNTGNWIDITDRIFDGPVPESSAEPIHYYIIDRVDLDRRTLSSDRAYGDTVVDQLLTIGPDGGKWLKEHRGKIVRFEATQMKDIKCAACGLLRTVSKKMELDGKWYPLGRFCAAKIELANQIHNATDEERHKLILRAAEVNAARSEPK